MLKRSADSLAEAPRAVLGLPSGPLHIGLGDRRQSVTVSTGQEPGPRSADPAPGVSQGCIFTWSLGFWPKLPGRRQNADP